MWFQLIKGILSTVCVVAPFWLAAPAGLNAKDENAIFKENIRQVVHVDMVNQLLSQTERGTGVFISSDGVILTALHVVGKHRDEDGRTITVTAYQQGLPVSLKADVIATLPEFDLALLLVNAHDVPFADISTDELSGTPALTVIVWGEEKPDWRSGKHKITDGNKDILRIGTATVDGNSGSPVYNANGQLVAILTNKVDPELSLAASLSAQKVIAFIGRPSTEQKQRCQKARLAQLSMPLPLIDQKVLTCDRNATETSDLAKIVSPPGYALIGLAEHLDEANEYGWIWAAEYQRGSDGAISSVSVRLSCSIQANSDESGYAKTVLQGYTRKILTKKDESDVDLACSKQ